MDYLAQIENQYNPNNDVPQGQPQVTWTDYFLLLEIKNLRNEIKELKVQYEKYMG